MSSFSSHQVCYLSIAGRWPTRVMSAHHGTNCVWERSCLRCKRSPNDLTQFGQAWRYMPPLSIYLIGHQPCCKQLRAKEREGKQARKGKDSRATSKNACDLLAARSIKRRHKQCIQSSISVHYQWATAGSSLYLYHPQTVYMARESLFRWLGKGKRERDRRVVAVHKRIKAWAIWSHTHTHTHACTEVV